MTLFGPNIKKMESSKDIDGLLRLFMTNKYHGDQKKAIHQALARIGEPAVKPLVEGLSDRAKQPKGEHAHIERFLLHWQAVVILKKMPSSQLRPLVSLIKTGGTEIRCKAMELTDDIEYKDASDALIEALFDPDVQAAAALALVRIPDKRAINGLMMVIENGNDLARENAAYALGQFRMSEHIPILMALLDDKAAGVRDSAIRWLGETKDRSHLPVIARLLDDKDASVRATAAEAVGKLGGGEYFQRLEKLLDDENDEARKKAAEAIGWLDRGRASQRISSNLEYRLERSVDIHRPRDTKIIREMVPLTAMIATVLSLFFLAGSEKYFHWFSGLISSDFYINYSITFIVLFLFVFLCFVSFQYYIWMISPRFNVDIIFNKLDFDHEVMLDSLESRLMGRFKGKRGGGNLDGITLEVKTGKQKHRNITVSPYSRIDRVGVEITNYKKLPDSDQKRLLSIVTDAAIDSFMTPASDD